MPPSPHRRLLFAALLLATAAAAAAGVPRLVAPRGWRPLVALAGGGDAEEAVVRLRAGLRTAWTVLTGLSFDERASAFLDEVREELGDFDLESFHRALPEAHGPWRRLRLVARAEGGAYTVRHAPRGAHCAVDPAQDWGSRPGDLAFALRARPVAGDDEATHYLLAAELGLGVGGLRWDRLLSALEESARLLASGDPRSPEAVRELARRPGTRTRLRLLESHPHLRPEDIEVLGTLWEAYPAFGDLVHSFGRVEDLVVYDLKGSGEVQQLRLALRLRPDLLEGHYPHLSAYLAGLGQLALIQAQFLDPAGRVLARCSVDTEGPRLRWECFVRDGALLPVERGRVRADLPASARAGERSFRALVDVRSRINGVETRVHGMQIDWRYATEPGGARLEASMTKVPEVRLQGAVFGFLPVWAVDAALPGDLDALTRAFLAVVCRGNGGRGARFSLRSRSAPTGAATLSFAASAELLQSKLLSFAVRLANLKFFPDDAVRRELASLLRALHAAFAQDLERFARLRTEPRPGR